MNVENLVAMANQIGEFFEAMPDRDEALEGLASHIRKFWAPRMRQALADHWASGHVGSLRPIVREALAAHSILPTPVPLAAASPKPVAQRHAFDGESES